MSNSTTDNTTSLPKSEGASVAAAATAAPPAAESAAASPASASPPTSPASTSAPVPSASTADIESQVKAMSIKQLKEELLARGLDPVALGLVEKPHLVKALEDNFHLPVCEEAAPAEMASAVAAGGSPASGGGSPAPAPAGVAEIDERPAPVDPDNPPLPLEGVFDDLRNPLIGLKAAILHAVAGDMQTEYRLQKHHFTFLADGMITVALRFADHVMENEKKARFCYERALKLDEIASIYLYTTESGFYRALNECLRSDDRVRLAQPFLPYLRLFLTALSKLPRYTELGAILHRGVNADLSNVYKNKQIIVQWAFSSFSLDATFLQNRPEFFASQGDRTLIQISAANLTCAVDIAMFSAHQEECEVLLLPGFRFSVSMWKAGAGAAAGGAPAGAIAAAAPAAGGAHITMVMLQQDVNTPPLLIGTMPPSEASRNLLVRHGRLLQALGKPKDSIDLFTTARAMNHPRASGLLAEASYQGLGCRENQFAAHAEALLGAKLDDPVCLEIMARFLMNHHDGQELDHARAAQRMEQSRQLLQRAWQLGTSGDSLMVLQGILIDSDATALDNMVPGSGLALHRRAFTLYQIAADLGNHEGMGALGECYVNGHVVAKDPERAFSLTKRAAELGHPHSMLNMAHSYDLGTGVAKDPRRATEFFQQAAEFHGSDGFLSLGINYRDGDGGCVQDFARAIEHFKKAIDLGNPDAVAALGNLYLDGRGVAKDSEHGFQLLLKASRHFGVGADVLSNVGCCYRDGEGVKKDLDKAREFFMKAAARGYERAIIALAQLGALKSSPRS